eukprot:scaffold638_cov168-Amphora_coffeaeformis.AAC.3
MPCRRNSCVRAAGVAPQPYRAGVSIELDSMTIARWAMGGAVPYRTSGTTPTMIPPYPNHTRRTFS